MAISHGFNKTEAATSVTAPVTVNSGLQIVVGTAPVNMLDDPEAAVNTPLLVNTFKEAAAAVGYSDDFAKYTLCEAVSASFQVMGISPIVVVNVLDPANAKHITELSNKTVQVNDGIAEIDETGILLKKLVVKKEQTVDRHSKRYHRELARSVQHRQWHSADVALRAAWNWQCGAGGIAVDPEGHRLHCRAWAGSGRGHCCHSCGVRSHELCADGL